jgi:hypothetical protein
MESSSNRLTTVMRKLDSFYKQSKIPHLLFHGSHGTGKKTLVFDFIHRIYHHDKQKVKENVMVVNCTHSKGIKFIRDDVKFFAKTNIKQTATDNIQFKIILLLNAEYLTQDAQSALRRCIELFSHTTRFFLVVKDKNKLLQPILSRFCEVYIPERDPETGERVNLYMRPRVQDVEQHEWLARILGTLSTRRTSDLVNLAHEIVQRGLHSRDVLQHCGVSQSNLCWYEKYRLEYRCETMLIFWLLVRMATTSMAREKG